MGKMVACPGGCGATLDYDAVPTYSEKRSRAGKFCQCGFPLDEATATADTVDYGLASGKVHESRIEKARAFYDASATKPKTPTP